MVDFTKNTITSKELLDFLYLADKDPDIHFSSCISLHEYCDKIINNADIFEAWDGFECIAVVAAYTNDPNKKNAYITFVYCKEKYRRKGYISKLISKVITLSTIKGIKKISLEVYCNNNNAQKVYHNNGFLFGDKVSETKKIMYKILHNVG